MKRRIDEHKTVRALPACRAEQVRIASQQIPKRAGHGLNRGGNEGAIRQKRKQKSRAGSTDQIEKTLPANEGNEHRSQWRTDGHSPCHRAEQPAKRAAPLFVGIQPAYQSQSERNDAARANPG
jgi:hypothetical protein